MKRLIEALVLLVLASSAGAAGAVSIVAVTPQGEVAQVRQVTVKFSEAVVAFGDPRLADPLAIACQGSVPAGSGRWANDRVWLYDFREPLGPGTSCTATVLADWKPATKAGAARPAATAASAAGADWSDAVRVLDRRSGRRLDAAGWRHRHRRGPALPAAPEWPGGRRHRRCQRVVRGRGHRRAARAQDRRWRRAGASPEGAPHRQGAGRADAARALRAAAAERRCPAARLGQGHRRGEQPEDRHHDRAALPLHRPRRLHGRLQLRARARQRAVPADPADDCSLHGPGRARARRPGAPASGRGQPARAGVRQGRQGDRGQRDRVPEAARRERRVQHRDAGDAARQRRPAARQRVELSAQGADRQRTADRQVRGSAVRRRRKERRRDAAGDAAPRAGRPARAERRRERRNRRRECARHGQRPGARQAPAERRRHPRLVRPPAEVPRDADDGEGARPARARLVHLRRADQCQGTSRQASRRQVRRHARSLAARQGSGRDPPRPAAARRQRPAPVRGRRHPARRTGLSRRRDRVAAARPVAARQARADVRPHRRPRHQPRRPLQARPREQRRLGDDARSRQADRRRRRGRQRLQRQAALERQERRRGSRRRRSLARAEPGALRCRQRLLRQRAQRRRQGRRNRRRLRLQQLAEGHRVVALQCADRSRRRARPARLDRLRPQPLSRRRDGVDEALRPRRDGARTGAGAGRPVADARQDRPPGQRPGGRHAA